MADRSIDRISSEPHSGPLFVVGMWRSGTSLLYALLNQHPQIALLYEGDLPLLWPLFLNHRAKPDWLERWDFWNGAPRRHNIDVNSIPENVTDVRTAMEAVYKTYAGLAIWGCKSPNYYDSLIRLSRVFPQARFIVIWRDPRDICRSILRAGEKSSWFAKIGMPLRALLGHRELRKQCDTLLSRGIPLHQLQYENMVKDPATAMAGICRFLGIPYTAQMASLEGADRSAIYAAAHHAMVKGSIIASSPKQEEVLPTPLKNKIERYIVMWRGEHGGSWPLAPGLDGAGLSKPSLLERGLDRVSYCVLRSLDSTVLVLYCFAPLSLLRSYRALKRYYRSSAHRRVEKALGPAGAD